MRRTEAPYGILILLLLLTVQIGQAQPREDQRRAVAIVNSNDPQAHVFADSTWLGLASREVFQLPVGAAEIRVTPSAVGAWGDPPILASISGQDTVRVDARFPYRYRLEATPHAAEVYRLTDDGWTMIGTTPAVLSFNEPLTGTLSFQREGFAAVELEPGTELWNRHIAVLQPLGGVGNETVDVRLDLPGRSRRWIDYAAVGAAVAGGILAVHYKVKADNRFDVYRETGDPLLRPEIDRLDDRSAIALTGMQAGVGVFALRLMLRR